MAKRMLIDANHPDETRVVVLNGKRIEEFDYETAARSQLKGNIYLAKITRVEPSLQAAFVEYGGNRHGFLPFSEIHPDYYKIPIADREALAAEEAALRGEAMAEEDFEAEADGEVNGRDASAEAGEDAGAQGDGPSDANGADPQASEIEQVDVEVRVDTIGGDEIDEQRRRRANLLRRYKIQEVIKRRQVILVQVAKEERGTKGAALTTYLSLAGRYCVLMPNTARGGGISRKIGSANDRRRLKSILGELEIPDGMAVIVRTAGAQRSKAEIRRDYEYLMRLWDEVRQTTLKSTAPCLIHEEANLIKRSIRDLYSRDMDEVWVEGEEGYKAAKAFMRSLMPSHAKRVKQYKDEDAPIFLHHQVEDQLEAMHSPTVQLKSGGYIVLNQTEALVAIDVNSGRATRERHIEETALKTNLEAAEEVARQLRLRDLAGLVVVDFIDMEESRHNRDVERRLKEAMRSDRARIQLGRVSPFGLLELSRQRLRPSLFESSTDICPRCGGSGHVRSVHSTALSFLRGLEELGLRGRGGDVSATVPTAVALYLLNQFRHRLVEVEQRYGFKVTVEADDALPSDDYRLEREAPESPRAAEQAADEDESGRKRRRGRRRRKGAEDEAAGEEARQAEADTGARETEPEDREEAREEARGESREAAGEGDEGKKGRRRRGRRGGRRRSRRRPDGQDEAGREASGEAPESEDEASVAKGDASDASEVGEASEAAEASENGEPSEAAEPAEPAKPAEAPRAKRRARPRRDRSKRAPGDDAPAAGAGAADRPAGQTTSPTNSQANGEASEAAEFEPAAASAASESSAESPAETPAETPPAKRSRGGRGAARSRRGPGGDEEEYTGRESTGDESRSANAEPPAESGRDAGAGRQPDEPTEHPDSPDSTDLPAAARGPGSHGEDDEDLPKRRGWWQRWV
ncbi:MAG: ribonuclease E/G [Kiloniellales bacterium]|nr:ribonuclease E/G [Kiloniellales bacterium]